MSRPARAGRSRKVSRREAAGAWWAQLRQAARSLARSPGFTLLAAGGLALGIGATTAVTSVVKAVLIAPLPYPEPDRLAAVMESDPAVGLPRFGLSLPDFADYERRSSTFAALAATCPLAMALTSGNRPEQLTGLVVSRGYFAVFGVAPVLGRSFLPEEFRAGGAPVVIISHRLWRQRFAAGGGALGRPLLLDGQAHTVVGVMPPDFKAWDESTIGGQSGDLWLPLRPARWSADRSRHFLTATGRLGPGVTLARARTDLRTIAAALAREYPQTNQGWSAAVDPLHEVLVGTARPALLMLLAMVGVLLLITCANVASLLLVRLAGKQTEIAVRSALGAGRRQLARHLLTESALLALGGGAAGLALGGLGLRALGVASAAAPPLSAGIALDGWMLLFTLALSLAAAALAGLLPVRRLGTMDLHLALREGGRSGSSGPRAGRAKRLLVAMEIALSLVLLVGAGLLLRSYQSLLGVSPGFDPRHVFTVQVVLPEARYPAGSAATLRFFRRLRGELRALPGTLGAAAVSNLPLSDFTYSGVVVAEGQVLHSEDDGTALDDYAVTPGYFTAMRIPLLGGRDFDDHDTGESTPVAIVSQAAARRFWPGGEPLGRRITFDNLWKRPAGEPVRWLTVVGVAGDVRGHQLSTVSGPVIYRPFLQGPVATATVVARTLGDPATAAKPLARAIWSVDSELPVAAAETLERHVADSLAGQRLNALLLGIFGVLALCLAGLGVYGVVSHTVVAMRREIGIRMALGAQRPRVLLWVVRLGMAPVPWGIAAGLLAALASSRLLTGLLYQVRGGDPLTIAGGTLTLAVMALLACLVPAVRATRSEIAAVLQDGTR
jgi:putative ABC transport system permease protein